MDISKLVTKVMEIYRRDLPSRSSTPKQREWFLQEFPHLDRGKMWNRSLYDFNVANYCSPHTTGICLSLALCIHEALNLEGEESEILFLYEVNTFCHAVVHYKGKYYDSFYPNGTENYSELVFSRDCTLHQANQNIIAQFFRSPTLQTLKESLYDKLEDK